MLPDDHDRVLQENVHPTDWRNPEPAPRYNLVVIGAGTAGLVTAAGGVGLGARVALVERHRMGGDCLNTGCVPSKALLRSARAWGDVRNAARFGVVCDGESAVDFGAVMQRMRELRAKISPNDSAERFRGLGVDVFFGDARFTSADSVSVGDKVLRFRKAVIATGGRAAAPPIPGLEEVGYLTNESVFSLTELPRRLAVIGAGPIGCELAQAFARFGSEVHLVEVATRVLIREDSDAAAIVERALRDDGVHLHLGARVREVRAEGSEKVLEIAALDGANDVRVDAILVAAGRLPNVEGLGLERAGVAFDARRGVEVDDRLRTSNPNVFAAGDVCPSFQFTHLADAHARIVLRNALFFGRDRASTLVLPWCTYTDPEIAHVGLYEDEAREQGVDIDTFVQPMEHVDRAILDGETTGFVKVHVRKGGDRILGATIVARHAGEMLAELTLAMKAGIGLGSIAATIHPYPSHSEAVKKVADAFNRTRLTPRVKGIFQRYLAWLR